MAGYRVAVGCMGFYFRHPVADPGAIERGWIVAAADRPFALQQRLAPPSAIHSQCISFPVDDVRIGDEAERKVGSRK